MLLLWKQPNLHSERGIEEVWNVLRIKIQVNVTNQMLLNLLRVSWFSCSALLTTPDHLLWLTSDLLELGGNDLFTVHIYNLKLSCSQHVESSRSSHQDPFIYFFIFLEPWTGGSVHQHAAESGLEPCDSGHARDVFRLLHCSERQSYDREAQGKGFFVCFRMKLNAAC